MATCISRGLGVVLLLTAPVLAHPTLAQVTSDPFPDPIETVEGLVVVDVVDFASIPDIDGVPARMMLLVDEPGTSRMFVNDMRGPLYSLDYDGRTVIEYLDINDPSWGVGVESGGRERGFQSFAFHPEFGTADTPGYGRFYTWTDTDNVDPAPDFAPGDGGNTHHTVLLEWVARDADAPRYDGGPPRELARFEQPFGNHNAGHLAFNPIPRPGEPDFGLLYMGVADGGSGGDPLNLSLDLSSAFGKVFRLDPLGSNSANGEYGIPSDNPFANDGDPETLGEIYASGVRNPQRFGWDPVNGNLFLADIGQNTVETVSPVPRGGNLGWNEWEGSFRYVDRSGVDVSDPRSDPGVTYPVVEYDQTDDLLMPSSAVTGVHVYRADEIPDLSNRVLFGDFPSGEIFYFEADDLPEGGQDAIRRILLDAGNGPQTFLEIIRAKNAEQGRDPATRTDLRFGSGPDDRVFLLNKHDGTIRLMVPSR